MKRFYFMFGLVLSSQLLLGGASAQPNPKSLNYLCLTDNYTLSSSQPCKKGDGLVIFGGPVPLIIPIPRCSCGDKTPEDLILTNSIEAASKIGRGNPQIYFVPVKIITHGLGKYQEDLITIQGVFATKNFEFAHSLNSTKYELSNLKFAPDMKSMSFFLLNKK